MIIIHHANCADGFCAAYIAHTIYPDAKFIPANYGDAPPNVKGEQVLILDFSYKRNTLLSMKADAKTIEVIDHHKSAEKDLRGLDFCHFDMNKSGAMLTWEWFYPFKPIPDIVAYVQDWDLWRKSLPYTSEINAAIKSYKMTFKDWDELCSRPFIPDLADEGAAILRHKERCIEFALKQACIINICGHKVPFINISEKTLVSETLYRAGRYHSFAVGWYYDGVKYNYNLRSGEDGVDVSKIAEKFAGGGHKHAAGFSLNTLLC